MQYSTSAALEIHNETPNKKTQIPLQLEPIRVQHLPRSASSVTFEIDYATPKIKKTLILLQLEPISVQLE